MFCSNCGARNRAGARFCSECGRPLADAGGGGGTGGGGVKGRNILASRDLAGRDIHHNRYGGGTDIEAFASMRGVPRVLITVGLIIAMVGFGCFMYYIVGNITLEAASFESGTTQSGPSESTPIPTVPWLPLGFGLFLLGACIGIVGQLALRSRNFDGGDE